MAEGRLDAQAVEQRLARLDELLERVEAVPGPGGEAALAAVRTLTEVYGEALARVMDLLPPEPLLDDELLGHLLVLHDLHPEPPERRAARALQALRERGVQAELAGVDGGVAEVRLTVKGCGSSAGAVEAAVREAVLAAAPELSEVRRAPERAFVPVDSLLLPRGAA
ncbi:NifU family protein [Kitasatospora aureofaciens]|uniref:NifU family protein n=1 Tax=Kitasatospora aureofaciens TaxID=1894 RepID=UPI0037C8C186